VFYLDKKAPASFSQLGGGLAMSRAIGDLELKDIKYCSCHCTHIYIYIILDSNLPFVFRHLSFPVLPSIPVNLRPFGKGTEGRKGMKGRERKGKEGEREGDEITSLPSPLFPFIPFPFIHFLFLPFIPFLFLPFIPFLFPSSSLPFPFPFLFPFPFRHHPKSQKALLLEAICYDLVIRPFSLP